MSKPVIGIIILAAGSSSRLGKPKQNLVYKGQTLLQRAIETAHSSACETIMVILGANAEVIIPTINEPEISIIQNNNWIEGIASSIRLGVAKIQELNPAISSVILMLCDQPFIDTHILNMLTLAKTKSGIAACGYNDTVGPPALFDKAYFDELLGLKGTEGAKKLLTKYTDTVTIVPFEKGKIDIDTLEDFEQLA
ncbi:molybdenum cofactor cytidylyltransferase [Mucilaginibacter frigoritolerans]|uniref:Molybdenum cofactor cytidylyltransferase n=1 Tax=Mucilaginibacter frigoritolerans TaxID=652788 RepID=A0A562U4M9_9SPHI|nr:nucleotidyltransferase family protein [Mucilaginibacter frigoritolerans]TWJ00728.1 molybdenum cofactor cytidylyltransferase [Mucilaginibacter frigoritolerans]